MAAHTRRRGIDLTSSPRGTIILANCLHLLPGSRLGQYEIVAPLGAGAMGDVYRAQDTKLQRAVAVKVLPHNVSHDPDRLARFEREARVAAALNHPNIAAIYGTYESEEVQAIVLELIEGRTLADMLRASGRGGLSLDAALAIARQVADGLDAAHQRGVVHRDLKPANIAVTHDGAVKILDFGIAKILEADPLDPVGNATVTSGGTAIGVIMGTAAYMSPEQARGLTVDKRTDIWAFGCVLFELLGGRSPFLGNTVTDTLAAVIEREPDWRALPDRTPPQILRVLRWCLQKAPALRLRDIADIRNDLLLQDPFGPSVPARGGGRWSARAFAAAALALVAIVAASVWAGRQFDSQRTGNIQLAPVRFNLLPPPGSTFGGDFERTFLALSPDGSRIAFVAVDSATHASRIWVRTMSTADALPIAGTEGARSLFWSYDGKSIGFFTENRLKRVDPSEGSPVTICEVPPYIGVMGTWGVEDILFASVEGDAIYAVSPSTGGSPTSIVSRDRAAGVTRVHLPSFLRDGKRFLYLIRKPDGTGELMLSARGRTPKPILQIESSAEWTDPGYLVYAREGALVGRRFDDVAERVAGGVLNLASSVEYSFSTARAMFTVSKNGTLAYEPRADPLRAHLTWFDRTGAPAGAAAPSATYRWFRLSPDSSTMLFERPDPELGTFDLWTRDLVRGTEHRITFDPSSEVSGVWANDGGGIVFAADRGGPPHLYYKDLATNAEKELLPPGGLQQAVDVSSDGRTILFVERSTANAFDLKTVPLDGGRTKVRSLMQTPFEEWDARLSRDGELIAFMSNESGAADWYVAAFDHITAKKPIAAGEVLDVRWAPGSEALYQTSDHRVYSVKISAKPVVSIGPPKLLFQLKEDWVAYDVSSDGSRFLAMIADTPMSRKPIVVVLNGLPARTN
jgi:eukaryotic-like serine/threonine-protein kinase